MGEKSGEVASRTGETARDIPRLRAGQERQELAKKLHVDPYNGKTQPHFPMA